MVYKFIRGRIVGKPNLEITPEDAAELGAILGSWYGEKSIVVSGRDYNPSSRMLKRAFVAGLMSAGVDVMDFHESLSGEVSYSIKRFGARGGVNVSTYPLMESHVQFRIFTTPGYEVVGDELANIIKDKYIRRTEPGRTGWVTYAEYIHKLYVSALTAFINSDIIANKKFNIVVSTSYGPSDLVLPDLFASLNVEYILLSSGKRITKGFRYPLISEIKKVADIVRSTGMDLGIILNNDASSLIIIDDNGNPLLPEETALILLHMIPKGSNIVISEDTFLFIDRAFSYNNIVVDRVDPSETSIMKRCYKLRPILGFNNVGEYIHPLFSLGYDAILTLTKVLESLASTGKKLSSVIRSYIHPRYYTIETSLPLEDVAVKICGQKTAYCRQYIGGYRVRLMNQNIAITYDPLTDNTRILIDAHAQSIDKIVQKVQDTLTKEEVQ
ncbi:MAG: phosphoglucomutase [Thermoprotei archaeon]|nr:MAG: phosphoglucomutase [Thermoprotei archaeon]